MEFLTQVANQVAIAVDNALAYGQITALKDQLAQEKLYLEDEIRSERYFEDIVGHSPALRHVLQQVETVAPTEATVLICGETGTGKELLARAIHQLSPRQAHAFVKLNCAAIPTGLLESELFGHEKGAFTGALTQRIGRFELAHRGTVFLDEIGDLPLEVQPKLLRVLQEREFERLGSSRTLRTDARLIAATNQDLATLVEAQQFRADLFYRVNVFPVQVPPLRERPDDIPLLVRHFVQQFARRMHKTIETIASDTMQGLMRYAWPGNIRELQNVIERAVILSPGPVLQVPLADSAPARARQRVPRPTTPWQRPSARTSGRAGGDGVGTGRAARRGSAPGDEALHPAIPPAQAGAHPSRPVTMRAPASPARLSRCPHVGTLPVGWQRGPGTLGLVALPRFLSRAAFQALPACWPTLQGLAQGLRVLLG